VIFNITVSSISHYLHT